MITIKNIKSRIYLIIVIVLFLTNTINATDINSNYIIERNAAIQRADQYTGFLDKVPGKSIPEENVELITLVDSTTPFLSKFTNKKAVWKVKFENVLVFDDSEKNNEGMFCNFDVYIDSVNGHLLKIESNLKPLDPYEDPEISAKEAERQISGEGELYISIPDDLPQSKFINIIPNLLANSKNVIAQYVNYRQQFIEPRPFWIITFRGIPPIEFFGGSTDWMPIYTKNRIRLIINDSTGRLKYKSTTPSLGINEEDKKRLFPDGFK